MKETVPGWFLEPQELHLQSVISPCKSIVVELVDESQKYVLIGLHLKNDQKNEKLWFSRKQANVLNTIKLIDFTTLVMISQSVMKELQ